MRTCRRVLEWLWSSQGIGEQRKHYRYKCLPEVSREHLVRSRSRCGNHYWFFTVLSRHYIYLAVVVNSEFDAVHSLMLFSSLVPCNLCP